MEAHERCGEGRRQALHIGNIVVKLIFYIFKVFRFLAEDRELDRQQRYALAVVVMQLGGRGGRVLFPVRL
jgi:hypothetical protein